METPSETLIVQEELTVWQAVTADRVLYLLEVIRGTCRLADAGRYHDVISKSSHECARIAQTRD